MIFFVIGLNNCYIRELQRTMNSLRAIKESAEIILDIKLSCIKALSKRYYDITFK